MRKEFTIKRDEKEIKLCVKAPSQKEMDIADKAYAAKIASLIRDNSTDKPLLRAELDKFLSDNGIWTQKDVEYVTLKESQVAMLLLQLQEGGIKLSKGREICISIFELRKDILNHSQKRQIFDSATIESQAERAKMEMYTFICTVDAETGEQYWPDIDTMKSDEEVDAYSQASVLIYEVVFGIDLNYEKNLPENKWLRRFNFVDDNLMYTDRKTGKKVDRDGNEVTNDSSADGISILSGDIVEKSPYIED